MQPRLVSDARSSRPSPRERHLALPSAWSRQKAGNRLRKAESCDSSLPTLELATSLGEQLARLSWWRRDDDPPARARQALAAMRAEKSGGGSDALWLDGGYVADNATQYDSGGAGSGGTD